MTGLVAAGLAEQHERVVLVNSPTVVGGGQRSDVLQNELRLSNCVPSPATYLSRGDSEIPPGSLITRFVFI